MKVARVATTLENGEQGFFLVSDQGEIHQFDPAQNSFGPTKNFKWSPDLTATAKVEGQVLSLRADGQIYEMTGNQWMPWAPSQKQKFVNIVAVPLYDAFEVVH